MVAELIDHIEVYHAEKQDGVTNQRVVIHYNCIGAGAVKIYAQNCLQAPAE